MTIRQLSPGDVFEIPHPFVREKYNTMDDEGVCESEYWRPGVRMIENGRGHPDYRCDGKGVQILSVVSVHKPGKYLERVFYTRRWRTPDGIEFGKRKLWVKARSAFIVLLSGYRYEVSL
jgi:hypothetical protein